METHEFKVGDVVRCIRDNYELNHGDCYVIRGIRDEYCSLYGSDSEYYQSRFELSNKDNLELINGDYRIGDLVECISSNSELCFGQIYRVVNHRNGRTYVVPENDKTKRRIYAYNDRFTLYDENMTTQDKVARRVSKWCVNNCEQKIRESKSNLNSVKGYIDECRQRYSDYLRREKELMQEIEVLEEIRKNNKVDKSQDIKDILNHKSVTDVILTGAKEISVFTDYIDIYDSEGNKFKGNKYELKFNYEEMTCYIYGLDSDYCRKGYWTDEDPHPHVDGDTARACWGGAGSMLTMNMNNYEFYASFITVLNFLQQVNVDDCAGKHISKWDCINEDGDDIENPYDYYIDKCHICDEVMDDEDFYTCEICDRNMCGEHYRYVNDEYVCDECFEEHFETCSQCGETLKKSDMYVCEECMDYVCEDCSIKHNGDSYHSDCYNDKFVYCDGCGEDVKINITFICDECGYTYCADCDNKNELGGETLCYSCYEEALKKEEEENEE